MRSLALLVALAFALPGMLLAQPAERDGDRTVRVLFVGNSYIYFNNLPRMVEALAARDAQIEIDSAMLASGGLTLEEHLADPATVETLGEGWDWVVLQQQSLLGVEARTVGDRVYPNYGDATELVGVGGEFAETIRQAGARPILFMTWGRGYDDGDHAAYLRDAYNRAARAHDLHVAPVGLAWSLAKAQMSGLPLHQPDGSHPTPVGSYFAACTVYLAIAGDEASCRGGPITGEPLGMDGERLQVAAGIMRSSNLDVVLADIDSRTAANAEHAARAALEQNAEEAGVMPRGNFVH